MVLTLGVGCYLHIVSTGFLRTFKLDVGIAVPRFNVYLSALMGLAGQEVNIMKKFISLLFVLFACAMSYGQGTPDVTRFLGIPVDGTRAEMISKLKEKGFSSSFGSDDLLEGEFNGENVYVSIQTNNRKVWRIGVIDINGCDETQIKINFNNLCRLFEENTKYINPVGDQTISEDEDIAYEITVHDKRYSAMWLQKSKTGDIDLEAKNRLVWFMISKHPLSYGKYVIMMFYENGYNKAKGEDL